MDLMQVPMEKLQTLEIGKKKIKIAYSQRTPLWIFEKGEDHMILKNASRSSTCEVQHWLQTDQQFWTSNSSYKDMGHSLHYKVMLPFEVMK